MKINPQNLSFLAILFVLGMATVSCKKESSTDPNPGGGNNPPPTTDSIYSPTDPANPATIGFFKDGWKPRTFNLPAVTAGAAVTGAVTDSLTINVNKVLVKVPPYVYGNNSNLWSGQMVNQPALMQYISDLSPNVIRGPGGSISDVFFWNGTDANPAPSDAPSVLLNADGTTTNAGYWYGGNAASWTFSLSNYYNLLSQTNSTGMITVNYGYARYGTSLKPAETAAHLAADWVRHDAGKTKFWEIGNETFGSWEAGYRIDVNNNTDAQPTYQTGALYGDHFKIFSDSMHAAATETGATIYVGATLYEQPANNGNPLAEQTWNQGVLTMAGSVPDFYIVHDYFTPYNANSNVNEILQTAISAPTSVMAYVKQQISAAGVDLKPIAMTEWNIRATGSRQNVSYIAGIHAAKTIGSIIKNEYGQASRWDIANGYSNGDDHGMFNNGDEPNAPLWNPRPSFFYLYYFQRFFGDRMVYDTLKALNNDITTYSSTFSSGQAGTVIINSGSFNHIVSIDFQHYPAGSKYYWYVLTGGQDNPPFSGQVLVNGIGPATPTGGPLNYATLQAYSAPLSGTIKVNVPALSVIYLVADKK